MKLARIVSHMFFFAGGIYLVTPRAVLDILRRYSSFLYALFRYVVKWPAISASSARCIVLREPGGFLMSELLRPEEKWVTILAPHPTTRPDNNNVIISRIDVIIRYRFPAQDVCVIYVEVRIVCDNEVIRLYNIRVSCVVGARFLLYAIKAARF